MTTDQRDRTVGFIGLGMMGFPMAANILKAGFSLVAYDIAAEKKARIAELGADVASGPTELAQRARIVVSMVDTTAQAEEVIVGPTGLIQAAQRGDVILSMGTNDPVALRRMHARLAENGVALLDAPVSGMEKGARTGTLKAFVGGDATALETARPVLAAMASEIQHLGAIGQGTVMKLVNNMLCQVGWIAVAEAMVLGTKAGLDPGQMVGLIGSATGNSVAFQYMAPRVLARDFEGIRLDITYKDVDLQNALARALGMPLPLASMAQQIYQMARAAGLGSEDGVSVIKVYEEMAKITVQQDM